MEIVEQQLNGDPPPVVNLVQLGTFLARNFNLEELESLCFDLGFEFEELGEGGRTSKSIRLIKYFERNARIQELAKAVLASRPNLSLQKLTQETTTNANQAPGEPPYKGLAYFDVQDADQFHGRDVLTAELVRHLHHYSFLAVVGASGSGKSSIVRAGLIPVLLGKKQLSVEVRLPEGCQTWPVHIFTPTEDPLLSMATSLAGSVEETIQIRDRLAARPDALKMTVQFLLEQTDNDRSFLFIDQFEELFTQCKDPDARQAFIDNLITAAEGSAIVVITLRADFYAQCARYDKLRQILSSQQLYLGPMNREELRQAIEQPAARYGWKFEGGLVDLLLEDVGATETRSPEPGALPLLSHALLETWKRREGVTMTLAGYVSSGGIRGAIAQTAEDVYQYRLLPEHREIARRIFLRLTELGEETQDTRRRAVFEELVTRSQEESLVEAVLLILTDARLVMVDLSESESERVVQVTHEALIREWPLLRQWLDESRENLRIHRQITADTMNWIRLNQDPGTLYRGARLAQAVEWSRAYAQAMNRMEREFIQSSRDAVLAEQRAREEARQRELTMAQNLAESQTKAASRYRWMVIAIGGAAVAMLVVIGILATPFIQNAWARQQSRGEMIAIPAGPVTIGTDDPAAEESFDEPESPSWTTNLPAFMIEKYEVTNRQYGLCVDFGDCTPPAGSADLTDKAKQDHPVVWVSVVQAAAYCEWIGRRLPTELEWERAARGPASNDRLWPWGEDPITADRANIFTADYEPVGTVPVTSYPAGATPEGIFHLVGNVWEWTSSLGQENFDSYEGYDPGLVWNSEPREFRLDPGFIQRGGSWFTGIARLTTRSRRLGLDLTDDVGFRCATG